MLRRRAACLVLVSLVLPALASAEDDAKAEPARGELATVAVPGDRPVYVVHGAPGDRRVLLYLHGRCGDPHAGIRAFAREVSERGTLISVPADIPCPNRKGRTHWTADMARVEARIEAAIQAVSSTRSVPLDLSARTVIGYSEGALRAESLAARSPDKYPHVVLLASPRAPKPAFTRSQRVALGVGENDVQGDMRDGAAAIQRSGVPSRLFVLPRASHGHYGPEGGRVMAEAFSWLFDTG